MAGRGAGRSGRGGRNSGGRGRGGGKASGRSSSTTSTTKTTQKGLCGELEGNVFDIGQRTSADLLRTTLEKIIQYVGTKYGEDIAAEIETRTATTSTPPAHTADVLRKHAAKIVLKRNQQNALLTAHQAISAELQAQIASAPNPALSLQLVQNNNTVAQLQHELTEDIPMKLEEEEKVEYDARVKSHQKKVEDLKNNRGKVYMLIMGQCTQQLQDKLKQDLSWPTVDATPKSPIDLINLIERVVLKQSETDQYPWATLHDADMAIKNLRQGNLTDHQWVERIRTRWEIAKSVGVERFCTVWADYCANKKFSDDYDNLTVDQQAIIRDEAKERYIAYLIVLNSGSQHEHLRMSLQEDFAKGIDNYPKTIQEAEKYLDKFPKNTPPATASEGTAFAQRGAKGKGGGKQDKEKKGDGELKPYNKKFFADKECFNCGKLGHPADSCPNQSSDDEKSSKKGKSNKKKEGDDDDASVSSIKKLEKGFKKMQKTLTQISDKIDEGNESDLSEEDSHFQFTFAQVVINAAFPNTANVLKQSHKSLKGLDMREIILLDSQSTICVFCNKRLLTSINKASRPLRLRSNGGSMLLTKQATIKNYKHDVWYSPEAITNIFSLKQVRKQYRVTYDSDDECFVVHRQDYGLPDMVFREHASGLHYYDPRDRNGKFSFVETVKENKALFTKRQIKGAEKARRLYKCLSHPSIDDFKLALRTNCIKDSPVTVADVIVAQKIYGPDIAVLKGKTTRKSAPAVVVEDLIPVPKHLINMHKNVTLAIDICFVNKIPFFVTLSRNICFTTATHLSNRTLKTIFKAFRGVFNFYYKHGFHITTVMADGEFAALQTLLVDIIGAPNLNLTAANEHEPFIERRIRVIKERVRALRYTLPFRTLPKKLVANMVLYVTKLLNFFPAKNGLSDTLSPKAIVTGEQLNYKHYNLPFGSYCQVHEETNPRNNMAARTLGAISLGSSGNLQGAQRFLSLKTGEVIIRYSWTEVPMPDEVIERVNYFGRDQPEQLTFADRHGVPIGDHDAGIAGVANDATDDTDDDGAGVNGDDAELPGVDVGDDIDDEAEQPLPDIFEADDAPPDVPNPELNLDEPNIVQPEPPLIEYQPNDEIPAAAPMAAPEQPSDAGPRRSTRVRRQHQQYVPSMKGNRYHYASTQLAKGVLYPDSHMFMQEEFYEHDIDVVQAVMTQLSLKAAIREWGDDAKKAAYSEAKQLHWRNSFKPVHRRELTAEQRKQILESHMFVKKKRDGTVKAREVAGGNKQRDFVSKEDSSSPTAATESVLLSCAIDAKENRETALLDIPNAFIQTVVKRDKDKAIIRICGLVADMLLEIAPEVYSDYVTKDKRGNNELLVICLNALYGTMVAALLFYEKFTNSLKSKGFIMNPYDPCVWNKIVNGKQLTIVFHVDDCKLSHADSKVLDDTVEWLRQDYESIFEDGSGKMKVSRGRKHKFLGMDLDFSTRGQCKVMMFGYVEEILAAWKAAEKIPDSDGFKTVGSRRKTKLTAAPENLFVIDEDCKKLDPVKAKAFHNIVAKALYVMKRARPDISVAIAFLTTRVRGPDQHDWDKLSHLMQYLHGTKDLPLILGADGNGIVKWFVDASFAVHPNMRSHTGGAVTLGRGCPIVSSTKQKLNTRSSTESELVGVDDLMPSILWTRKFLKAQGYDVTENILYQDNKSSILLEKNGKASSSKRTRHISIRYFFVTDRIAKGELTIEWCPTANMIADFMTKPLQGALFRKFRDIVMGINVIKSGKDVSTKKSGDEVGNEKSRKPVRTTTLRKAGKSLAR